VTGFQQSLVCLAALALASASASRAGAETIQVDITKLVFAPAEVAAHVGDTIEWVNADFLVHTATARTKEWEVMLPVGKSGRLELKKAGTMDYYCRLHPNMTGRIKVTE
jgi:plastocyanin